MTRELPPEELEGLKERGWRQIAAIDAALERGEIGEDGWHHAMADLLVPAYLSGDNPRHSPATRVTTCGGKEPGGCRFDFVRTNVDYAPPQRRPDLLRRLVDDVVEPGGRLIVGVFNKEAAHAALETAVSSWGLTIAGRAERAHPDTPELVRRAFWIDASPR